MLRIILFFGFFWSVLIPDSDAQYFGRNKPKYRDFDFKIFETDHFKIYYYDLDSSHIAKYANWFEIWYERHSKILDEQFEQKNPVLLFNHHGDFQQNFAISGQMDVGTGGVTEGLKNRIVLPVAQTNNQTFHVIGHELVHAFQYQMILHGDSTSMESLQNYPLWIIEGLAEYLTKGRFDMQTAMWMHDAVNRGHFPPLDKLDRPEYFPYRYGHAFWSFFSGFFGDSKIKQFFMSVGHYGLALACKESLGIELDTLSNLWKKTFIQYYKTQNDSFQNQKTGKRIISEENGGRLNLSPSISPNGKYVCFLSEKDLFTTDLYLSETGSGKIIKKLFSQAREGHIDQLNGLESAGTWSPDSKKFAFTGYKFGKSVLIIKDVESGKTLQELQFKNLDYFSQPNWSPDGKQFVVTGIIKGQTDLFTIDIKSKKVNQLTNDVFSEIHPEWTLDGKEILYSTDARSFRTNPVFGYWTFDLAQINVADKKIRDIPLFENANHFNPQQDAHGNILFVSDRTGRQNVYSYQADSGKLSQFSFTSSGITGITPYAPSISVSGKRDKLVFSQFRNNSYEIYQIDLGKINALQLDSFTTDQSPAWIPFQNTRVDQNVQTLLSTPPSSDSIFDQYVIKPYRGHFGLSYVGASGGAGYGGNYISSGVGLTGGIDLLFNDMLGHHQLYTGLALNGEIYDIAAAASYLNRSWKFPWGVNVQHLPSQYFDYTPGFVRQNFVDENGNIFSAYTDTTQLLRIFEEQFGVFIHYPISVIQRLEAGIGTSYRFFRLERIIDFYDDINKFFYLGGQKEKLSVGDAVQLGPYTIEKGWLSNVNAAWVGDNSYFGLTAPMLGHRYRIGIENYFGQYEFFATTLDARKYFWSKPFSFAFRFMHYARYGQDANRFYPLLIGQYGLIHGYDFNHLDRLRERYDISYEQISGSKIAIGSFELRLPLFGPSRFALLSVPFLPIDLNIFIDGGIAWDAYEDFSSDIEFLKPLPVFSAGAGLRINLFGALVLEPYWAWPLRKDSKALFGFNFIPGW
ncbi:MAG: PD40 domain-containing protein [Saprospiraceae bacterium]|nr:PD40 domain-containing protein [Saprospiraceae bacterium]